MLRFKINRLLAMDLILFFYKTEGLPRRPHNRVTLSFYTVLTARLE